MNIFPFTIVESMLQRKKRCSQLQNYFKLVQKCFSTLWSRINNWKHWEHFVENWKHFYQCYSWKYFTKSSDFSKLTQESCSVFTKRDKAAKVFWEVLRRWFWSVIFTLWFDINPFNNQFNYVYRFGWETQGTSKWVIKERFYQETSSLTWLEQLGLSLEVKHISGCHFFKKWIRSCSSTHIGIVCILS